MSEFGTLKKQLEQLELERSVIIHSSNKLKINEIRHYKILCAVNA